MSSGSSSIGATAPPFHELSLVGVLRPPPALPPAFWARTRNVLRRRVRVACAFGLLFRPAILFGHLGSAPWTEGSTIHPFSTTTLLSEAILFSLFAFGVWALGRERSEPFLPPLLYVGYVINSTLICSGFLALESIAEPRYQVLVLRNTILILASGLFLPWPGLWIFGLGAIPLVVQTIFSLHLGFAPQIPILLSCSAALFIAVVGGQIGFDLQIRSFLSDERVRTLAERRRNYMRLLLDKIGEPIRSLIASSEDLLRARTVDQVEALGWQVEVRARRAHASMRNLLGVSLLEESAARDRSPGVPSDVSRVAKDIADDIRAEATLRRLSVECEVPDELLALVSPPDLARVLSNLVEICVDRLPPAGRIAIRGSRDPQGDTVIDVVADGASPLSPTEAAVLLDGREGVPWEEGNLGIGLYLVRGFVRESGGSVELGRGDVLEFRLRFPGLEVTV